MSYIILIGRWCNIIVLNVQIPCEDKSADVKDSLYVEVRGVSGQFPTKDTKIFLGNFNSKVGRENMFKLTIGSELSQEISNDNAVNVVKFATSKTFLCKEQCFLIATFINTPRPLLRE
jgi:hypothetical protein